MDSKSEKESGNLSNGLAALSPADAAKSDPKQGISISLCNVSLVIEVARNEVQATDASLSDKLSRSKNWIGQKCCITRRMTFKKKVLQNITGNIYAGEMYALLGPSGAGKTTLLDVISKRKTVGDMTGKILFDSKKVSKLRLKTETAYIQQQDVLLGYFTVSEYVMFHAFLKLPEWITAEEKKRRSIYAIEKLGLKKCMHSRIGEPMKRGVSGGERKRVCIALGLLTEPKCLFLDEPTSGLDSSSSLAIINSLKKMTELGMTIRW